jgi:hypothetical protein
VVHCRAELESSEQAHSVIEILRLQAEEGAVTLQSAVKDPSGAHVGVLLRVFADS